MNKIEELENKLKEMQDELAKLKKEKKESKRWRAEEDEIYYAIGDDLDIGDYYECGYSHNDAHYKWHNYFQNEAEAQSIADNIKTHIELMELAEELNTEPVDWKNSEQRKYFLLYLCDENKIAEDYDFVCKTPLTVYCTNENFKKEAIRRIGEERLIKYLKGE